MSTSKAISKLKKYIADDRPRRLRVYVKKHSILLSDITLNKGRNLLHYCCKYGSGAIMKYLISKGVSSLLQDASMNTPLHLALHRALSLEEDRQSALTTICYTEMILPLIERFPGSLEMRNNAGETCRNLLHTLVQKREPVKDNKTGETSEESDIDERMWRDKLADECQYEFSTTYGKYQNDFFSYAEAENEAYDDWADRIREEFYAKKKAQNQQYQRTEGTRQSNKHKHSDTCQGQDDELKNARAKMRKKFEENQQKDKEINLLKRRMKYELRYKELVDCVTLSVLRFDDIPWPCTKGQEHDITVLFEGMDRTEVGYKKYLRDQQIRWHPDKFMQRFGEYLDSTDKDRIVQRVTVLSQNLNKLAT